MRAAVMPSSAGATTTAGASARSRTSVMCFFLAVSRLRPVDDLAHQENELLELRVVEWGERLERDGLPRLIESVEHPQPELRGNDVDDPAILRVADALGESETDHAIDERARGAERALLHARDLVHRCPGRRFRCSTKLFERNDLMPRDGTELASQLLGDARHQATLDTADAAEEQVRELVATSICDLPGGGCPLHSGGLAHRHPRVVHPGARTQVFDKRIVRV